MVNSFCCFRLQTAGIIIGWAGAGFSLINIASYIAIISNIDDFTKDYIINNSTNGDGDNSKKSMVLLAVSISLTINVINCVASCMLVAGTIKERHLMIVPWLINSGIAILYNILNVVAIISILAIASVQLKMILLFLIVGLLTIGIEGYAWLSIHSLFKMIRLSSEQQRLLPNNKGGPSYSSYTTI